MRRQRPWWALEPSDMDLLGELQPGLVQEAMATGSTQRALLGAWWRQVTGRVSSGPQVTIGPVPTPPSSQRREGVPTFWLRGYGVLEGRAAGVYAVYAARVQAEQAQEVPVALQALASRLLLSGEVRELRT